MFKQCNKCGYGWKNRQVFLADKKIVLIGYQAHFEELTLGLFLFNHSCKTTISLTAGVFTDLYRGPIFKTRKTGSEKCPGYCLRQDSLSSCSLECECAYIRELMQIIMNWNL